MKSTAQQQLSEDTQGSMAHRGRELGQAELCGENPSSRRASLKNKMSLLHHSLG